MLHNPYFIHRSYKEREKNSKRKMNITQQKVYRKIDEDLS